VSREGTADAGVFAWAAVDDDDDINGMTGVAVAPVVVDDDDALSGVAE
jgi:hypothetical protein